MLNMQTNTKISKILVVDDEETSLLLISTLLSLYDFTVVQANNGPAALKILKDHAFDLILLDIMMPEMDGFEVCKRLKAAAPTQNIPVIFVSAYIDEESRAKGTLLGAEGFVNKPFMADELISAIVAQSAPAQPLMPVFKNQYNLVN